MFAQIYECRKCGDVWNTYTDEIINTAGDDLEVYHYCSVCDSILRPKLVDGKPIFHPLTPEEMKEEIPGAGHWIIEGYEEVQDGSKRS
jgi:hypothetical protein